MNRAVYILIVLTAAWFLVCAVKGAAAGPPLGLHCGTACHALEGPK